MGDAELEAELLAQLQEQVHSLTDVEDALQACPDDPDLLELKSQLEQGIVQFRDSLHALQQHIQQQQQSVPDEAQQDDQACPRQHSSWDDHLEQQQDHVRPRWLLPDVACRFRYSDGLWHRGIIQEWSPQQQLPVTVKFAYPTRYETADRAFLTRQDVGR